MRSHSNQTANAQGPVTFNRIEQRIKTLSVGVCFTSHSGFFANTLCRRLRNAFIRL